jgi:hypothetical protein
MGAMRDRRMTRSAIWFGVLGGAAAWTLHLLLAYLIAEFGCVSGRDAGAVAGIALPAFMLLVMSLLMLTMAVAAALAAGLTLRRLDKRGDVGERRPATERAMARIGLFASALFAFIILVQSVPILFYLRGC